MRKVFRTGDCELAVGGLKQAQRIAVCFVVCCKIIRMLVSFKTGVFHLPVVLPLTTQTWPCHLLPLSSPLRHLKSQLLGCYESHFLSLSGSMRSVNARDRWITFCVIIVLGGKRKFRRIVTTTALLIHSEKRLGWHGNNFQLLEWEQVQSCSAPNGASFIVYLSSSLPSNLKRKDIHCHHFTEQWDEPRGAYIWDLVFRVVDAIGRCHTLAP